MINKRWNAFRERDWPLYNHYKEKVKNEIMIAKKNWANKHKETANGLWKIVKEIRGSRASNPFSHLRQQYSREIDMIDAFTHEFQNNYNSCPDVESMNIGNG